MEETHLITNIDIATLHKLVGMSESFDQYFKSLKDVCKCTILEKDIDVIKAEYYWINDMMG